MDFEHLLHEGERAYGAWYYNATARHYHGVDNPLGAMDGTGPVLENDARMIERHIQRLSSGRPVDVVVQDLLETGKNKSMSPHERMLKRLSVKSKLGIYRDKIR
jgi:hypothetical protein